MAKPHIDKTLTALAGEFLVAGHLCLKGYMASLTLKNYPKVDIFCLNPKNGRQVAIQVKTIRSGSMYYVPENVDQFNQPFVFVFISGDDKIDYYVVPSAEVARISETEREDYLIARPNVSREQPRMIGVKSLQPFKDRWDLLGMN